MSAAPPLPSPRAIAHHARVAHDAWLARHVADAAERKRMAADSARVRGQLVTLTQGTRVVGRYTWRWLMDGGRPALRFRRA